MFRRFLFSFLTFVLSAAFGLLVPPGWGQANANNPDLAKPSSSSERTKTGVGPNDIVVSISGVCDPDVLVMGTVTGRPSVAASRPDAAQPDSAAAKGGGPSTTCKTEVTRAQFEKLMDAVGFGSDRANKIRSAVRYGELMKYAEKAKALGVENDPVFQERVKYSYLNLLWQAYHGYLVQQANNFTDAELQQVYKEKPELFLEIDFLRAFVPNEKKHATMPSTPDKIEAVLSADVADMKKEAEALHKRALAGEDLNKLQTEAFHYAGQDPADAPDLDVGDSTRADIPYEYGKLFDLQPGQIADLIEAQQGWYICKIITKKTVPLSDARVLWRRIRLQEAESAIKSTIKSNFSDAYFNMPHGMDSGKTATAGQKED